LVLIDPGKPVQNDFIESFNGRLRHEHMNETLSISLMQAGLLLRNGAASTTRSDPSGIDCLTRPNKCSVLTATGQQRSVLGWLGALGPLIRSHMKNRQTPIARCRLKIRRKVTGICLTPKGVMPPEPKTALWKK
jgi:hypothetical protein